MIHQRLHIPKGTLSYWLSDIPYTPNTQALKRIQRGRVKSSAARSRVKKESLQKAKILARKDIGKLSKRDIFMLGIGLYIGEGAKTVNVAVINSDVRVIQLAVCWFETICGLKKENFTIEIHMYPDNNVNECVEFWSKHTGVPKSQFGKSQIDSRTNKKMAKRGKLRYGTAHLKVRSRGKKEFGVFLQRRIHEWMNLVLSR